MFVYPFKLPFDCGRYTETQLSLSGVEIIIAYEDDLFQLQTYAK